MLRILLILLVIVPVSLGESQPGKVSAEGRAVVRLRSQPADVTASDVKDMLTKYNFYSRSVGWNKNFCNESGDFRNDLHDNLDGTVTDRATGLMWQKDGALIYTTWSDAKLYIERLNRERFAGYADWRLPTIEEFASLIEREPVNHGLYIDPIFTDRMWFWSIDPTGDPGIVWTVNFHYGSVYWLDVTQGQDVKAVRSLPSSAPVLKAKAGFTRLRSEPEDLSDGDIEKMLKKYSFYSKRLDWNKDFCNESGDFKNDLHDNGDGTITDRATGLMWQLDSALNYTTWDGAKAHIESLNEKEFAGYADWRLPTAAEFASLMEREKSSNGLYIDPIFSNRMWFWTIDTRGADSGFVWTANFHYGIIFWLEVTQGHDVKAVRSLAKK
jgi:hypothetical protein